LETHPFFVSQQLEKRSESRHPSSERSFTKLLHANPAAAVGSVQGASYAAAAGEEAVYLFVYQLLQLMRRTLFFFHVDEIIMLLEYI
jgi:hypothetical protein